MQADEGIWIDSRLFRHLQSLCGEVVFTNLGDENVQHSWKVFFNTGSS